MRKGFAPVLIILIVVALIVGAYLFGKGKLNSFVSFGTPMPSATNNSKTYKDAVYGFSFDYPNNWFIKNISNSQYLSNTDKIDLSTYKISVRIDDMDINQAKFFLNYGDAGIQNKADINYSSISEKQIIKTIVTTSEIDHSSGKYTEKDTRYVILIPLRDKKTLDISSDLKSKDIVDQILSTFKFTP